MTDAIPDEIKERALNVASILLNHGIGDETLHDPEIDWDYGMKAVACFRAMVAAKEQT